MGRDYANAALRAMQRDSNPALLSAIVRDMSEAGDYGAIEVGFMTRIGQAAISD